MIEVKDGGLYAVKERVQVEGAAMPVLTEASPAASVPAASPESSVQPSASTKPASATKPTPAQ